MKNYVSKRNIYRDSIVDTARSIAITLMVIDHLGMKSAICKYLRKRAKRLLVPYILFALIYAEPGVCKYFYVAVGCRQGIVEVSSLTPLWFLSGFLLLILSFN